MKRLLILPIVVAALSLAAGAVCYGQPRSGHPPRMFFFRHHAPAAMFGDGQYLYVTAGGKILEYKLDGMKLEHSVDLPACGPPPGRRGAWAEGRFRPMPPPPAPPTELWAANGKLYVLEGPAIYVYKTPGLRLEKSVKLPGPKPPQADK